MLDADLLMFIRSSIRSTWSLELLLLMRDAPDTGFAPEELVRALRATSPLVASCLEQLRAADLVVSDDGRWRYAPANDVLKRCCDRLAQAYSERPVTVVTAIVSAPDDRLRSFADAFQLKKKDD